MLAGGGTLRNHGTVLWTGGTIFIQDNSAVVNDSTGVWEAQGDLTLTSTSCGSPTFTNAGTLRKTAGHGRPDDWQLRGDDQHRHDRIADRDASRSARRSPRAGI